MGVLSWRVWGWLLVFESLVLGRGLRVVVGYELVFVGLGDFEFGLGWVLGGVIFGLFVWLCLCFCFRDFFVCFGFRKVWCWVVGFWFLWVRAIFVLFFICWYFGFSFFIY